MSEVREVPEPTRMRGTVIRVTLARGFGFLERENGRQDVFLHRSELLAGENWNSICIGTRVEFDLIMSERGRKAINVKILSEEGGDAL